MTTGRPSAADIVKKGEDIYERNIRPNVESDNIGRFIAIDTNSGAYEIGDDHHETALALKARVPNSIICTLKIGFDATVAIGGRLRQTVPGPAHD